MEYDYTSKRLGKRVPPHGHKIIVCGKCGRRGTDDGLNRLKDGRAFQMVTHASHIISVVGVRFNHVDDHCVYAVEAH